MKLLMGFIIVLFASMAYAGEKLEALIQQNINAAEKSYDQVLTPPEKKKKQVNLWIHVRSEKQAEALNRVLEQIKNIELDDSELIVRPVQLVTYGPKANSLRFFKQKDKADAKVFLTQLVDIIPNSRLQNLSKRYKDVPWVKTGHFELWLAPNVTSVVPLSNE